MTKRLPNGRPFVKGVDARRTVLDAGPDHPAFFRALSYATDYGIGRPTQPLDLGVVTGPITVITGVPDSESYTPANRLPAHTHQEPRA